MHANIQHFEVIASAILRHLYKEFPAAVHPTPKTIGLSDEQPQIVNGRQNVSPEWIEAEQEIAMVLRWLQTEELIHKVSVPAGSKFFMSAKGFKALERRDQLYPAPLFT